jgi:hypothetical protein
MTISSSSSQASAAELVRCAGSLTSRRPIQSEMLSGTDGFSELTGGIGVLMWRIITAIGDSVAGNGTRCMKSSNAITPTA